MMRDDFRMPAHDDFQIIGDDFLIVLHELNWFYNYLLMHCSSLTFAIILLYSNSVLI